MRVPDKIQSDCGIIGYIEKSSLTTRESWPIAMVLSEAGTKKQKHLKHLSNENQNKMVDVDIDVYIDE